jgi:hypothetical protein
MRQIVQRGSQETIVPLIQRITRVDENSLPAVAIATLREILDM